MQVIPALAFITLLAANTAMADIYKCDAGINRTVYSDKPCNSSQSQSVINVPNQSVQSGSTIMQQVGDAVKNAIRNNDLNRAEALATTNEQKTWVAEARREAAKNAPAKTESELNVDKANSEECIAAQKSLEKDTRSSYVDPNIFSVRTSVMRAKCGIKEPETLIVNGAPYYIRWPRALHPQPNIVVGPAYDRHMQNPWQRSNPN